MKSSKAPNILILLLLFVLPAGSGVPNRQLPSKSQLDPPPIEMWTTRYNGTGNDVDEPIDLAVDDSGNVFVTGRSEDLDGSYDIVTIKYDSGGHTLWIARHDGTYAFFRNPAAGLEIDHSGNVYVLGTDSLSMVTIKYDANGVELWESTFAGVESYGTDIATDDSGNVFISGTTGNTANILTIKYDAGGIQQWVQRYSGYDQGTWPSELVADGSGGVWVTGYYHKEYSPSTGLGFQMITLKYGPSGDLEKSITEGGKGYNDFGKGIVIDKAGNIFVAGDAGNNSVDYRTHKYDRDGNQIWEAYYDSPDGEDDYLSDIALDTYGNLIVTGVSSVPPYDFVSATVKYDGTGVQQWATLSSLNMYTEGKNSLDVDNAGGIYVTGYVFDLGTSSDYATIKYDSFGIERWVARYNGPSSGNDYPSGGIAVDNSGSVYVTGSSENPDGNDDYLTIKYGFVPGQVGLVSPEDGSVVSSDSIQLSWNKGRPNVDHYWLEGDTDSLFSTPFVDSLLTDTTYLLTPLHHNSTLWWRVRAHNSLGWGPFSEVRSFLVYQEIPAPPVPVDPPDSAVGVSTQPTLRWNPSLGSQSYTIQVSDAPDFSSLIVNGDGVDTSYQVNNLQKDMTYYWRVNAVNDLGTSGWSDVWSFHTALAPPAQVLLISPENGSLIVIDSITFQWRIGTPDVDKYWFELSIDSLFSSSTIDSTITDTTHRVSQLNDETEYFWKVKAHNAAGWGPFSDRWSFHILLESVKNEEQIPREYSLSQNYPNPFNPTTVIQYGLPKRSHVKLELFSLIGQRVAILVDAEQEPGYHSASLKSHNLASGLYFYRLEAGEFAETKKLILLR